MTNDWIKARLKNVTLFRKLSDQELDSIVKISQVRVYKPRTFVFMQGEPLERVFFIQSGTVKIYKTDINGKEQIVSILQTGEMFPHAGFFVEEPIQPTQKSWKKRRSSRFQLLNLNKRLFAIQNCV